MKDRLILTLIILIIVLMIVTMILVDQKEVNEKIEFEVIYNR